jgi:hypothetical protein
MTINLPNGVLKSKDLPFLGSPNDPWGASPTSRTFLRGRLICLCCQRQYKVKMVIFGRELAAPYKGAIPFVDCPDCNATIMNLGAANARVVLQRVRKRRRP